MAVNGISSYDQFKQAAQQVQQQGKDTPTSVKGEDLENMKSYLASDDAKQHLTAGQIQSAQHEVFELGAATGQPSSVSSTLPADHNSTEGKQAFNKDMDDLLGTIDAGSSNGQGPKMATGLKDAAGNAVNNIPAGSALAAAASADGAKLMPVKQADGKPSDMFVVTNKNGGAQVFGGDGAGLGGIKPGASAAFKIANPAPGQDPYVKVSPDGSAKTGKDQAAAGITAGEAIKSISGTGKDGGYTTPESNSTTASDGTDDLAKKLLAGIAGIKP